MQFGWGDSGVEAAVGGGVSDAESGVCAPIPDDRLSAVELVDVITHCAAVASAAAYRRMTAASQLHELRAEEYLCRRSEAHDGQADSVEAIHQVAAEAAAGRDPYEQYGPDGFEQATAELGAALMIPAAEARELIRTGDVLRYRLLLTGNTLACGRIDERRFTIAVRRTDFVSDADMVTVDAQLAEAILARAPMSVSQFTTLVDWIVARYAPEAVKQRSERAKTDRSITISQDRFNPGQARIRGNLPIIEGAALNARLSAMAGGVHNDDPRLQSERRAAAFAALAEGRNAIDCHCPDCTPDPGGEELEGDSPAVEPHETADKPTTPTPAETMPTPAATVPADAQTHTDAQTGPVVEPASDDLSSRADVAARCAGAVPTFHIVVNLSTLVGLDDDPGLLDGMGLIDAASMRELVAGARRSFINPAADSGTAAQRYAPSAKVQTLVRAGELGCTFPGCNLPSWEADLDHTVPFDHTDPRRGGPTVDRNLKPLCRFHHRIKTFGTWRDYQDEYQAAWFQSPTGHTFVGNAFNGRDIFGYLVHGRAPDHVARRQLAEQRATRTAAHRRRIDRWNEANPPPF